MASLHARLIVSLLKQKRIDQRILRNLLLIRPI